MWLQTVITTAASRIADMVGCDTVAQTSCLKEPNILRNNRMSWQLQYLNLAKICAYSILPCGRFYHMVNHTLAHRSYGSRETLCLFFQTLANLYSCHLMQLPEEPSDALSMQFEALSFLLGPVMVRNQAPKLLLESAKGSKAHCTQQYRGRS